jgi:hypothetical protein
MGFKLGAVIGFGAGYYLGAKAGRERYEQLNRWAQNVKQSDTYGAASAKVRDLADEGYEKARVMASDGVAAARSHLDDDGPDPTATDADERTPDVSTS